MPRKKKKYNARFPPARIKKIMQLDEDVGKVAAAVPVLISKALEIFVESLLTKSLQQTQARSAKTMSTSHIRQCILSESTFDFLKDLVENVPDMPCEEDEGSQPPVVHRTERKHRQHRPRRKRVKDGEAGPSNSQLVKQSSEEPSSSEDDTESDEEEGMSNSDSNNISQDPPRLPAAAGQIPSTACIPGQPSPAMYPVPQLPLPTMGVFQAPASASGTVQTGMGAYQPPKNNNTDDDENYDT
ncbi:dr1-associated corepressor-like [Acanthaster planci]|uniref:Dr1-associated corepressor n=1 Tax=Acanthaster planci TaxID=133434 RepID=A0A8B7Y8L6_ACAPL|nr:dr1-associated corepressor-like [Acanthaster planci]